MFSFLFSAFLSLRCHSQFPTNLQRYNKPCFLSSSSLDSDCGSQLPCDHLVSPIALAACTRVDSCFAPWFVPSFGVSLQLSQLELHLCHHLEQLGTGMVQHSQNTTTCFTKSMVKYIIILKLSFDPSLSTVLKQLLFQFHLSNGSYTQRGLSRS